MKWTLCNVVVAGQKRKRAEDQAAALVGIKKPNTTPTPEADRGPSAFPLQGETMDHNGDSVGPPGKRAEPELHVDSLGGVPQVPVGRMLPLRSCFCFSVLCHLLISLDFLPVDLLPFQHVAAILVLGLAFFATPGDNTVIPLMQTLTVRPQPCIHRLVLHKQVHTVQSALSRHSSPLG